MIKNITQFLNESDTNLELDPFGEENWGPTKRYKIYKTVYERARVDYVAFVDAESEEEAREKAHYVYDWEQLDYDVYDSYTGEITVVEAD